MNRRDIIKAGLLAPFGFTGVSQASPVATKVTPTAKVTPTEAVMQPLEWQKRFHYDSPGFMGADQFFAFGPCHSGRSTALAYGVTRNIHKPEYKGVVVVPEIFSREYMIDRIKQFGGNPVDGVWGGSLIYPSGAIVEVVSSYGTGLKRLMDVKFDYIGIDRCGYLMSHEPFGSDHFAFVVSDFEDVLLDAYRRNAKIRAVSIGNNISELVKGLRWTLEENAEKVKITSNFRFATSAGIVATDSLFLS